MEQEKEQEPEKKSRRPKKAKGGHGGHHGGAWKVAYADFVTAMMALFLVLWLVSQADTKLKEEIANYFRSPGAFKSSRGGVLPGSGTVSKEPKKLDPEAEQQALFGVAQNLKEKFSKDSELKDLKDKVKMEITDEGLKINVIDKADSVSFNVGGATLNKETAAILGEIALAICKIPNPIKIGGHTDSRVFPSDNGYTNWELSTDRANAARRELQKVCVKPSQIKRITGYADTQPINPDDRFAPANRRISIIILRRTSLDTAQKEDASIPVDEFDKSKLKIRKTKTNTSKSVEPKASPESESKNEDKKGKEVTKPKISLLKEKLKKEGQVRIGKPDKTPLNITKRKSK